MNFIKSTIDKIKNQMKTLFDKKVSSGDQYIFKAELSKFKDDIELLKDHDLIDNMIAEKGIHGTAKEYQSLNFYYKKYYNHLINKIIKASNTSEELKNFAKSVATTWDSVLKEATHYLYTNKMKTLYGNMKEADNFSGVRIYHANSFADQELPWLRKENINELGYFDEGLIGVVSGAIIGPILGVVLSSLSKTFKMDPKALIGVSITLGAIIGHFIQKHFFIDFTNYIKLRRYIEYNPEAYPIIIEMMQKNAQKFRDKDPAKYKQILENLKKIKKDAPRDYRDFIDAELELQAENPIDPDLFNVYTDEIVDKDRFGNIKTRKVLVKRGRTSPYGIGGPEYTLDDLGYDYDQIEADMERTIRYVR